MIEIIDFSKFRKELKMNTIKYDYHENHERLKINKSFNIVIMKINNNHNKT